MAPTTIQVKPEVKTMLDAMKLCEESYNDLIERLIEDSRELSGETLKDIKKARAEIAAGKCKTHSQLGKEMGF
jgi:predicted CopG family antitoxin